MSYATQSYLWMTLDPVHIGTGGYRLGRVDNSIVREPGTRLPKIPGTSLSGAARSYAAMQNESPQCAGQGGHCQQRDCPICYTFGSLKVEQQGNPKKTTSYAGTINIFDAQLLFFPVHSLAGPVWVTSPDQLRGAGVKQIPQLPAEKIRLAAGLKVPQQQLNLGWLLLEAVDDPLELEGAMLQGTAWDAIKARTVLVTDKLFSQIVNSNLEVRTSVSIDPETGAAEKGALFTYEAIPRSAFLVSAVVEDSFRQDKFPVTEQTAQGTPLTNGPWRSPLDVAGAGLKMIEWLGVGGMGTRGFGRMRVVHTENISGGNNA